VTGKHAVQPIAFFVGADEDGSLGDRSLCDRSRRGRH
jgi:hypothetical protein